MASSSSMKARPKHRYKPMLCSSSSTHDQVKQSITRPRSSSSTSSILTSTSSSSSEEPSSPRVGCMGQVKAKNHYNVAHNEYMYHTHSCTGIGNSSTTIRHLNLKLKGLFSSTKIRATGGVVNKAAKNDNNNLHPHRRSYGDHDRIILCRCKIGHDSNCRSQSNSDHGRISISSNNNENCCLVDLKDMDPPLPVVKRVPRKQQEEKENMNLWKRRSKGAPIKSLEVQLIHDQHQYYHVLLSANTS